MEDKYVYIIFQERQLSTNPDYQEDGILLVDDCSTVIKEVDEDNLIEYLQKNRSDDLKEILKNLSCEDVETLKATNTLNEILEEVVKVTEGIVYGFCYQNVDFIQNVFLEESRANEQCKYYINNPSYRENKYRIVKYRVSE